jgi:hypothetical protein
MKIIELEQGEMFDWGKYKEYTLTYNSGWVERNEPFAYEIYDLSGDETKTKAHYEKVMKYFAGIDKDFLVVITKNTYLFSLKSKEPFECNFYYL